MRGAEQVRLRAAGASHYAAQGSRQWVSDGWAGGGRAGRGLHRTSHPQLSLPPLLSWHPCSANHDGPDQVRALMHAGSDHTCTSSWDGWMQGHGSRGLGWGVWGVTLAWRRVACLEPGPAFTMLPPASPHCVRPPVTTRVVKQALDPHFVFLPSAIPSNAGTWKTRRKRCRGGPGQRMGWAAHGLGSTWAG